MIIIVARYNENIDWTIQFPNVLIYNKGLKLNIENEILLDNFGREGHTYYKYIYDNYENLEDYTIFLQGNPFDHAPNIINNLYYYLTKLELDINFEFLSEKIITTTFNLESLIHGPCYNIHNTFKKIFNIDKSNFQFNFGAGAQFIVSKEAILKNSKDFYLNIIKILEKDISPDEGYDIERFHKLIFTL
jgi:hypothetical protein